MRGVAGSAVLSERGRVTPLGHRRHPGRRCQEESGDPVSPQTVAEVRAWENNELFQDRRWLSFLPPKLVVRSAVRACSPLAVRLESRGTGSASLCTGLHLG